MDVLAEVVSAEPGFAEDTARVRLKLLASCEAGERLPHALVSVRVFPACEEGQRFRVSLAFESLEKDEYFYSSLADGVYLQAEYQETPEFVGESGSFRYVLSRFQERFAANVARYLPNDEGAVLSAMASGDKSRLTGKINDDYRDAGISHLLVVSGLHLSLVCGVFATRTGRLWRVRSAAAILLVLFMMGLTGFSPSVLRAGIGALILHLGSLFLRSADTLTSMGIAAVLISFQGPYAVCDLAFQLSFAAALGVVLAGERLQAMRAKQAGDNRPSLLCRLKESAASLLLPTVFAALFTLPVQLLGGLSVSGVTVLSNLLALPLAGYCVVFGMLAGVCGFAPGLEFAARSFSLLGGLLAKLLNAVAALCAGLPLARLPLPRDYSLIVLAASACAVLCVWRLGPKRLAWLAALPLVMLGVVWAVVLERGTVELAVLGTAASPFVAAVQDGQALVVFRGGESNAEDVQEYLQSKGVDMPEWVIDLRTDASSAPPTAAHTLLLKDFAVNEAKTLPVCDIMATVIRLRRGGLVLLDVDGYKTAVPVGAANTGSPVRVDLAVTGSIKPANLRAETLIVRAAYDWQAEQASDVYFAPRGARVLIRPGRAAVLKGGNYALQQNAVA
ncbi:MAG TPA: ComEC/Rec2 family competence protein [Candidatus Fournierella excrementigallinarum]|nr:ComEC/Rec2 family competence protein [Candidatus Fournierella excrementigallinarum]